MSNPLETETGSFHVLANDEGQHSLWPEFIDIPAGWRTVFGPDDRRTCLDYVDTNWTDMRPLSLVSGMHEAAPSASNVDVPGGAWTEMYCRADIKDNTGRNSRHPEQ